MLYGILYNIPPSGSGYLYLIHFTSSPSPDDTSHSIHKYILRTN